MRMKILVVEDDPDARDALVLLLGERGYELETASDVDEAVAKARAFEPTLILCDWRLAGGTDGVEAVRAIHRERPVPVVFVTAHSLPELRAATKDLRVQAYLAKPIDTARLMGVLASIAVEVG
jgi:two-component system response regulator AtoC